MLTRQITLSVSSNFALPEVYKQGTFEEVEEALWIGSTIQQSIRTRRSNDELRKIMEIKDSEINQIKAMYQEKQTKLLDDLRTATVEKDRVAGEYSEALKSAREAERDVVSREWEEKLRNLRQEHEILSGRYEGLESRRRALEESRNKDIQDAIKRTEEIMEKLVSSKQDQLIKLETAYERLQDVITKQTDEISKLSSNLGKRSANVKNKGTDYEQEFGEKLKRNYGLCYGFQLKDTHLGKGHEMDFSMNVEGHCLMWELKNYTSVVPKAEVDKFLRDLKENPQAKIGVMISRSTDITGKNLNGLILTEFDNDRMMIYINRFEEFCGDDESRVFQMLLSMFRIWWEYHREETNTFDRTEMIRELERAIEDISKRRTDWKRHKSHLDEVSRWAADLLDESESRLDRLLKKARNCEETEIQTDRPLVIPEGVFRESGEEKEQGWMKSIMKMCVPGGEIEVRELVDLLGGHHKLSKDTIRSNVMSIIKDSAVIKKGVVKYIKGISKFVPECQIKF